MNLPPHQLITTHAAWQSCLQKLQKEPTLAIDLEANSMYAYREQVCLIQISIPEQDYLIDPMAEIDLSGLGQLIENAAVEKIFHAAEYDLTLLKAQYGWQLHNLFDTMWAARILGYQKFGLASILNELFDVQLDKKYQKSNWCKRPLSHAQRNYAQLDTHFLFALHNHMVKELEAAGRIEEAAETFRLQTHVNAPDYTFDPDSFWSINGARDLTKQQRAVLKALHIYRNKEAQRRNQPLFKVFGNKTLMGLARELPKNLNELRAIHGMSHGQVRRYGQLLLRVIEKGLRAPHPKPPKRSGERPSENVLNRYDCLHNWRKLRARKRGVESDVIVSRNALWAIAHANPQTNADLTQLSELGSWHRQTYGAEILELIRNKK